MIKAETMPCFDENQTIYFNIRRLSELENITGKSIFDIYYKQSMSVNFCAMALTVGMQHHYPDGRPSFWLEKIEEYIEKGGFLQDIYIPISKAIQATGLIVKTDKENGKETTEKNV